MPCALAPLQPCIPPVPPHMAALIYSEAKVTSGLSLRKQKGPAKNPCLWFVWIHLIWSEVHGDMFNWSHYALGHNFFLQWHVLQLSCIFGMEIVRFSCRFIIWIQIGTCIDKSEGLYFCALYQPTPSSFTMKDLYGMKHVVLWNISFLLLPVKSKVSKNTRWLMDFL